MEQDTGIVLGRLGGNVLWKIWRVLACPLTKEDAQFRNEGRRGNWLTNNNTHLMTSFVTTGARQYQNVKPSCMLLQQEMTELTTTALRWTKLQFNYHHQHSVFYRPFLVPNHQCHQLLSRIYTIQFHLVAHAYYCTLQLTGLLQHLTKHIQTHYKHSYSVIT